MRRAWLGGEKRDESAMRGVWEQSPEDGIDEKYECQAVEFHNVKNKIIEIR
jgi:hypothetical protein